MSLASMGVFRCSVWKQPPLSTSGNVDPPSQSCGHDHSPGIFGGFGKRKTIRTILFGDGLGEARGSARC